MRSLLLCSLALLVAGILALACTTADPNDCFVNTSGGFGGPRTGNGSSCDPCNGVTAGCVDVDAGTDADAG
jgi:hypothetical protein